MNGKNIGFVSTRFAGVDGVSLEASKWARIFEENGHRCYWFAGQLDRDPSTSFLTPEAHFDHADNRNITAQVCCPSGDTSCTRKTIRALTSHLNIQLRCFIDRFDIDLLVVQNALAIPMHIPLGLALTEVIAETCIPTIAHHHDFYWERSRYLVNGSNTYFNTAFPPKLPNMIHVVINSDARENLARRRGIPSAIIPNIIDFHNLPDVNPLRVHAFRKSIGLKPEDKMVLQPTRVVRRKGIEHAIDLVRALDDPSYKLVISHEAGDEGFEYAEWLQSYASECHVDLRLVTAGIKDPFMQKEKDGKGFSLWDIYPSAELITYPSSCEGFGNALLEAIYFKKPVLINRYPIYKRDIEPKGFDFIEMDGCLSRNTIEKVKEILKSPDRKAQMVNHNYAVGARYYSYGVLRRYLAHLMANIFSEDATHTCGDLRQNRVIYLKDRKGKASDSYRGRKYTYAARI